MFTLRCGIPAVVRSAQYAPYVATRDLYFHIVFLLSGRKILMSLLFTCWSGLALFSLPCSRFTEMQEHNARNYSDLLKFYRNKLTRSSLTSSTASLRSSTWSLATGRSCTNKSTWKTWGHCFFFIKAICHTCDLWGVVTRFFFAVQFASGGAGCPGNWFGFICMTRGSRMSEPLFDFFFWRWSSYLPVFH
jgi:hypothetical protein